MGKVEKKRLNRPRVSPAGIVSVKPNDPTQALAISSDAPLALKKLANGDVNDKVWAAASIGYLLKKSPDSTTEQVMARKQLLANNVVGHLIDALSNPSIEVVLQASGSLCNLAMTDEDIAREMIVRNDFFENGVAPLIQKLSENLGDIISNTPKAAKMDVDERNSIFAVTKNIISTTWGLSENFDIAIKKVNKIQIVPFLMSFLSNSAFDKIPKSIIEAAALCLYTLTDNNQEAQQLFLHHQDYLKSLMHIVGLEDNNFVTGFTQAISGGVLNNVKYLILISEGMGIPAEIESSLQELNRVLLPVLNKHIQMNIQDCAKSAEQYVQYIKSNGPSESQQYSQEHSALNDILDQATNAKLVLELLANIFAEEGASPDDDDEPRQKGNSNGKSKSSENGGANEINMDADEDMSDTENIDEGQDADEDDDDEDDDDNEEFDEDDMANILADEGTATSSARAFSKSSQSMVSYFAEATVPSLFNLMMPTPVSFSASPADCDNGITQALSEAFSTLHQVSIDCFSNYLLVVEEAQKTWFVTNISLLKTWWTKLLDLADQTMGAQTSDVCKQQREAAMGSIFGCMWVCLRGFKFANVLEQVPVNQSQVSAIIQVCQSSSLPSLHVKCIGVLGLLGCRQPGFVTENKMIGTFLIRGIQASISQNEKVQAESLEPVVEALDGLFDIYSDCAFDYDKPVFVDGGLLKELRGILPGYRKIIRLCIDRRTHRQLRGRADLALVNLRAFIDFKAQEAKGRQ
ncbi:hypothetical protein H4219_001663 [Mycoemilia scoparia]|uniref:SYO1-like TPR repeats domain-containing protein n=1 Tax=Mycoemilia scoparia TaxID=417184 RepID=A0A9W8DRJ6_9FUNG|nr:hypothetical protein H4219_001663 [Mycoemilia scoparia]